MPSTGEPSEDGFECLVNELTSQYSDICSFMGSTQIFTGSYSHEHGIFSWRSQLDPSVRPSDELLRWYACMCVHVLDDDHIQCIREEFPDVADHEVVVVNGDADQYFPIIDEYPIIPVLAEAVIQQLDTRITSRCASLQSRAQVVQGMKMAIESGLMFHLFRRSAFSTGS